MNVGNMVGDMAEMTAMELDRLCALDLVPGDEGWRTFVLYPLSYPLARSGNRTRDNHVVLPAFAVMLNGAVATRMVRRGP